MFGIVFMLQAVCGWGASTRKPQEIAIGNGSDKVKFAFGSCYGLWDHRSDIFDSISKEEADVFIWLGDVAYVDSKDLKFKGMPAEYV